MSKTTELPEDFDLPIPIPDLPPNLQPPTQTVDEVAAELKRSPFFMTSPSDALDSGNVEMEAIRALMYEGTRAEVAEGFRESGNELAKQKKWSDAKAFYTKGIVALRESRKDGDPSGEQEDERERNVREACFINRALCNLELKNYRSCGLDCQSALQINPANVKAHYRLSLALFSLQKNTEALEACRLGLSNHPSNSSLLALQENIDKKLAEAQALAKIKVAQEARQKLEALTLKQALKIRKIVTGTTGKPPDMEDAAINLVPDPVSLKSTLTFPVVLLYPLHLQSDFIKAFGEEQTLLGHLEYLLPLPWDEKQEYTLKDAEAYMETREGGLIKWGKKVPLLKVLSGGKVEVLDGIVRVNVLPAKRAGGWIETVKTRSGKK